MNLTEVLEAIGIVVAVLVGMTVGAMVSPIRTRLKSRSAKVRRRLSGQVPSARAVGLPLLGVLLGGGAITVLAVLSKHGGKPELWAQLISLITLLLLTFEIWSLSEPQAKVSFEGRERAMSRAIPYHRMSRQATPTKTKWTRTVRRRSRSTGRRRTTREATRFRRRSRARIPSKSSTSADGIWRVCTSARMGAGRPPRRRRCCGPTRSSTP